jgi:hypothetical protein
MSIFSLGLKLPLIEEVHRLKQSANVSPDSYDIKDEIVRDTAPKDGLIINNNPGPGDYKEGNNISDVMNSKSTNQSSSFISNMGKSWYSH